MLKSLILKSIYSDGSVYYVSNPTPKKGEKVKIYLSLLTNNLVKGIYIEGKQNGVSFPVQMKLEKEENNLSWYSTEVQIFENEYIYNFLITFEDSIYYYTQRGIFDYSPNETGKFRILTDYHQPEWVKNAVFYQIFPERFCNGKPEISVKDNEFTFNGQQSIQIKDWNSTPLPYDKANCLDFYGGDLYGIIQKIPYLKKLGVTALYLNPIFYGATVHKYDCLDYFHVDPHFGGDEALAELTEKLHQNGMKIILDVSINHTGIANRWFNKEGIFFPKTEGAYNNPKSKERDFYFFNEDGSYKSWFDVETLPTLNYTSQALREIIFLGKDSLVKKWLKAPYSTDGWRFDVADTMARNDAIQLHHEIWPQIRKSILEENKDAYILCEDWSDSSEFLNGNEWDSQMNYYGSCRPIRQFFGQNDIVAGRSPELSKIKTKMSAESFIQLVTDYLSKLPFVIQQVQFNLLDSHDVSRLHNDKNLSKDQIKGALSVLFTLPGCTNIYYGDEADIDGTIETMEGCRYPMPWNRNIEELDSYKMYSKLIHLKTSNEALKDGGFKVLYAKDKTFCYARFTPNSVLLVMANQGKKQKLSVPVSIFGKTFESSCPETDIFGTKLKIKNKNGNLQLTIPEDKTFIVKL